MAVPLPLSRNTTPGGKVPISASDDRGDAYVVTRKLPRSPCMKVMPSGDVKCGAAFTVRVKLWVAFDPTPFAAVMVSE
jgi:hypothetical protein